MFTVVWKNFAGEIVSFQLLSACLGVLHSDNNVLTEISLIFKLVKWICRIDQQKAAWFESDFCASCILVLFCLWNFVDILLMWLHFYWIAMLIYEHFTSVFYFILTKLMVLELCPCYATSVFILANL